MPGKLTIEGLQECKKNLVRTTAKLEKHMNDRIDQLVRKMKASPASAEELAELTRLREEWDTARQCIDICSKADTHLTENITMVDNYGTGDTIQFIVSTDGNVVHGKNRGVGWKTRQAGGHMNDASLQQLSRDFATIVVLQNGKDEDRSSRGNTPLVPDEVLDTKPGSEFKGPGFTLASGPITGAPKP
jgi:uncharacterized protein YnzC (UPF0291/DUF896 family)